jgi:hypothetical protein
VSDSRSPAASRDFFEQSWISLEDVRIVAAAKLHDPPGHLQTYEHWNGLRELSR